MTDEQQPDRQRAAEGTPPRDPGLPVAGRKPEAKPAVDGPTLRLRRPQPPPSGEPAAVAGA
ncbi:MAG TPA: hypothetical protein VFR35_13060, partial [Actinoplanes sp.]|nr:hypothetical protein [Actinoplanes sp.]